MALSLDGYADLKLGEELSADVHKLREETSSNVSTFKFRKERVRMMSKVEEMDEQIDCIVYWMNRDQRVQDNWAFLYAQRLAIKNKCSLKVFYCIPHSFLEATYRHYKFMLEGLSEVERECIDLNIPFLLFVGDPVDHLPQFIEDHSVGGLVTDHSPLKICKQWLADVVAKINIPVCQVDAHNVVPVWEASPKQEYMAPTIRPKLTKQLGNYLTEFPPVVPHPYNEDSEHQEASDWNAIDESLTKVDRSVGPVEWAKGGTAHGYAMLHSFIERRLAGFAASNYQPDKDNQSHLGPWIRFGHISSARCVLEVQRRAKVAEKAIVAIFLEQCIVRKELSENYCFYQENYDSLSGAPDWGQKTLALHRKDKREKVYTIDKLDRAKTHEDIWNVCQVQFLCEGVMHGFLRMYWAKKILEWTSDPETALATAIYLNNRYALDGLSPNTYTGCMWGIGGLHDQAFKERDIFGKVRYMNYDGCKKKMKIPDLVAKYPVTNSLPGSKNVPKTLPVQSAPKLAGKRPADEEPQDEKLKSQKSNAVKKRKRNGKK